MSKKNLLFAITNGIWLLDVQSAEQLGHNVASVLSGKDFWKDDHKSHSEFMIVEPKGSYLNSSLSSAKPGSVAVITISGPIMKEDNCGDPGTKSYEAMIQQAASNPNITGIVLMVDSPGGTVSGTQSLSNTIKSIDKPIVTLADDLMASAAYWIGSSTDFIFANTGTTRIGSIGTMLSFADMQPVWEKMGVNFHEIYATASTAKNQDFKDARQGNYKALIQNTLDPLNNEFMNAVKENRGSKLNSDKTLNGQVYTATDALKYGLIDQIGNINDAVAKVHELASVSSSSTAKTTQPNNMKKITLLAAHAAIIALCGAKIEAGQESVEVELNDDLLTKINETLAENEAIKASLITANEKVKEAEKAVTDNADKLTALEKENTNLKAKVAVLENPGASGSQKKGEDIIETKDESKDYRTTADDELEAARKKIYGDKA